MTGRQNKLIHDVRQDGDDMTRRVSDDSEGPNTKSDVDSLKTGVGGVCPADGA